MLEIATRIVKEELGYGMLSHSKSAYREANPGADPAFNAYILWQDERGYLLLVHVADLELTDVERILKVSRKLKSESVPSNLYVYRESTVHNETFNGNPFPYTCWSLAVIHGEIRKQSR